MLPYRLRPPVYGGKLQKHKEQVEPDELIAPYANGGPLQRAVYQDLKALRVEFQDELLILRKHHHERHDDDDNSRSHLERGTAFQAFRSVFGAAAAKVAVIHTRLAPPRCDRGAYAQLLYAACLFLLREAFQNENENENDDDATFEEHAAYAVFCLYALYETNPLSQGPANGEPITINNAQEEAEILAMLPMGLQTRENPKILYRRAFRGPIRIDQEHYGYLMRLRDLALAKQADCQADLMSTLAENDGDANNTDTHSTETWTCRCAVATDLVHVLDRLRPNLDLCSYTGPCGLEALAGHSDYPYSSSNLTRDDPAGTLAPRPNPIDVNVDAVSLSSDLQAKLQSYLDSRGSIRLPPVLSTANSTQKKKSKQIRDALMPMFHHNNDALSQLTASIRGETIPSCKRIKVRHVTFGTVVVNGLQTQIESGSVVNGNKIIDIATKSDDHQSINNASLEHPVDESSVSYDLLLPPGLTSQQELSAQAAIQTLLSRDNSILLPPRVVAESSSQKAASMDEVSTLGPGGGVSIASSGTAATGTGRQALQALLSQVAATAGGPVAAGHRRPRQRRGPKVATTSDFFLHGTARDDDVDGLQPKRRDYEQLPNDRLELSDLSSSDDDDDDDDALSVAASAVGQKALSDLLAKSRSTTDKEDSFL